MIKRTTIDKVPSGKNYSKVQLKAVAELRALQADLAKNPLGPYQVIEISLDPIGKSKAHLTNTFLTLARDWFKEQKLPYVAFTRTVAGGKKSEESKVIFVTDRQSVSLSPKGRVRAVEPASVAA